jgi:hypothetical protein
VLVLESQRQRARAPILPWNAALQPRTSCGYFARSFRSTLFIRIVFDTITGRIFQKKLGRLAEENRIAFSNMFFENVLFIKPGTATFARVRA